VDQLLQLVTTLLEYSEKIGCWKQLRMVNSWRYTKVTTFTEVRDKN